MTPAAPEDFSARLDALWDFNAPAKSEARFREELARHTAGSREARETATQLARSLGLQRSFDQANATLDTLVAGLDEPPARIRVRYLLERGRARNSSGKPAEAVPLFRDALAAADKDDLPGADYYRVDALHMLGIAAPADTQLEWTLKALAVADASTDARARGWRASLLHNLGWTGYRVHVRVVEAGQDQSAAQLHDLGRVVGEARGPPLVTHVDDAPVPHRQRRRRSEPLVHRPDHAAAQHQVRALITAAGPRERQDRREKPVAEPPRSRVHLRPLAALG
jgi:hypothetical protein